MSSTKKCFVIMPFGQRGTEEHRRNKKIYDLMIKPVVEECGYESIRSDELQYPGNITKDIIELLHKSDLVVADLSDKNANVFYELGVRHTLFRCGTIPIIHEGEQPPFDLFNYRVIYYASELDGPEQFKKELKERIKAFEKIPKDISDNPVHDVLDMALHPQDLSNYVPKKSFEVREQKIVKLTKQLEESRQQIKEVALRHKASQEKLKTTGQEKQAYQQKISQLEKELQQAKLSLKKGNDKEPSTMKSIPLRSETATLSTDDVKAMIKKFDFFDKTKNKEGQGFQNHYKIETKKGDKVVIDENSGLMWQQSGSSKSMLYKDAKKWIDELNKKGYAGFSDWRLPTLEEAMSLMEPKQLNGDLYIDPKFEAKQRRIWTSDPYQGASRQWVVYFDFGGCYYDFLPSSGLSVRAVRFGQSSPE